MVSPLQPGDHYILRKLCNQLLPWMIAARKIRRQWFMPVATIHGYGSDLIAASAALGIGGPIVAALQAGELPAGQSALDVLQSTLPPGWFEVGVVALILWVILLTVVHRQNVVERAALARAHARSMDALDARLWRALAASDPMPQITDIQKSVDQRVQDAIQEGVWPLKPPVPRATVQREMAEEVKRIRNEFMENWAPPPVGEQILSHEGKLLGDVK